VLDDLLEIIRSRGGSILKGSSLDPAEETPRPTAQESLCIPDSELLREYRRSNDPSRSVPPASILQTGGSVLKVFPRTELPELTAPSGAATSSSGAAKSVRSERARVAEQLLKSARLLENLENSSATQQDLLNGMRVEAANLLRE